MDSLRNVTGPLDNIWKALGSKLNQSISSTYSGPLKSSLTGRLDPADISAAGQVYGIGKSAVILVANILIAILEIVLWVLKGLVGLVK